MTRFKTLTAIGWLTSALLANFVTIAHAQVVISEFMADNANTLVDEDGDSSDWIELYNPSANTVNLDGWYLTDDEQTLAKWRFPATNIPPRGFLLVFASGKNRTAVGQPLHANFSLGAAGEYLALVQRDGATVASAFSPAFPPQETDFSYGREMSASTNLLAPSFSSVRSLIPPDGSLGTSWTLPGFNDATWISGQTGIGYETAVPGFAVRNVKANGVVDSLTAAEAVLADPALQAGSVARNESLINYYGTGGDGHYGNNAVFPGHVVGTDVDDFVIEVTATVTIPTAGTWTFGVSSDDGFGLSVGANSVSFPSPRGPADTLGTFTFSAAGDYDLRLVFYERGGGSELELFAAPGAQAAWNSTSFRLVGDTANGGLAVRSLPVAGGGGGSYRSLIRTDVQVPMKGFNASAYLRVPVALTDPGSIESLFLRMKYDDGFVAYWNGQEVARRNAPATPSWNSAATASRPNTLAVQFEEINISAALSALQSGANTLAVHGLNQAADDFDFLQLPEVVEYRVSLGQERFFSTGTPGTINSGALVAFVADTKFDPDRGFYDAPFNVSITNATPGATIRYTTNGTVPSLLNGFTYTAPILVTGTTTIRAAAFKSGYQPSNVDTHTYLFLADVIRQSPNGSAPPGWPASWGANVVDYGMDPSVVDNPAYAATIQNDLKAIPTFSVVMNLQDLFDPATGIYANPGQDGSAWERPCSLELIHPDGTQGFQIDAGIRIRGGFSRSTDNPKHAFRFFFRQEYGDAKLVYPLFGDGGTDTFDAIDLRTFQNYSWSFQGDGRGVFMRDQFSRDAQLAMGQQGERGGYYHLYVNGQYWGLYNTCERPEASYGATYFGGNKEDYDVIKVEAGPYSINATDGTLDAWTELYNLAKAGLSTAAAYQRIQGNNPDGTRNPAYKNLVDVDNLIDYMLVILYGGNLDAPISNFLGNSRPNNWYGMRNRTDAFGGFRFFAHDAEHTLLNVNEDRTGPYPAGNDSVIYSSPQWIWQQLQANTEFRMRAADRIHRHFFNGGTLTPTAARALLATRTNEIHRAVVGESARWGDAKREPAFTRADWLNAVNAILNNFIPTRTTVVLNQLRADGLYPSVVAPAFSQHGGNVPRGFSLAISAPAGTIYYTRDGTDPRLPGGAVAPGALVYTAPLTLNESAHVRARALSGGVWSALNEASFYVIQTFTDLMITEVMYNPPASTLTNFSGGDFEFVELKNTATTPLELSGLRFTNGISFTFPIGTFLAPGEWVVLVRNADAFTNRYPGVRIGGVFSGSLANEGERLTLVHANDTLITSFAFGDRPPWPLLADGGGFSLVPANPNLNPDPENAANWRASSSVGGSPGADDAPVNIGTIWITEALTHTDPPQLDTIELHNPNATNVDVGNWFLTDQRAFPQKFRIPAGTVIPAGGYLTVTEAQFNANPASTNSFLLDSHGEEVFLYSADAAGNLTGYSDGFTFGAAQNGVSFGRYVISTGEAHYPAQITNSLGAPNIGPRVGPVVINEIRYQPATGEEEFVELKNLTANPVPLYDPAHPTNSWRLSGLNYSFPAGSQIPAGGLLLLVNGDPSAFRQKHGIPPAIPILGPTPGTLQDSGELLQLQRPDAPDLDTNTGTWFVPYIDVDAVRYNDKAPWPTNAAGGGPSLERIVAANYGNDPINWRASPGPASPGLENSGNRLPQVNAGADLALLGTTFPIATNFIGTVTDDGQPNPPGTVSLLWSQASGPGAVVFSTPSRTNTTVEFPGVGTYVLRLTADDGDRAASDELTVLVQRAPATNTYISAGSTWRYLDNGSNQGTAWRALSFSDAGWSSGAAQFGYGDGDEITSIGFGPNAGAKYITSYFRRTFTITNKNSITGLAVNVLRDDGAVVYLNGTEVFRSNMPVDAFDYLTPASSAVGGTDESTFYSQIVSPALLVEGTNVLAVEIHQSNGSSSDLSFDLALTGVAYPPNQPPTINAGPDVTVDFPASVPLDGSAVDDGLPIPPGQLTYAWTQVSGPGTATITPPDAVDAIATFSAPGTYVLRLTAGDGALQVNDDLAVTLRVAAAPSFTSWTLLTNPDRLRLEFNAAPGLTYTVQSRDSLTEGGWVKLADVSAAPTPRTVEVIDSNLAGVAARFYRIVTPQQP